MLLVIFLQLTETHFGGLSSCVELVSRFLYDEFLGREACEFTFSGEEYIVFAGILVVWHDILLIFTISDDITDFLPCVVDSVPEDLSFICDNRDLFFTVVY